MNRRLRLFVALVRRLPHPDPPSARYLSLLRTEPRPRRLLRTLTGSVPPTVTVRDTSIELDHGPVRMRVYRPRAADPEQPLPLVINFHGGGFVFGNLTQTDWLCGRVSESVGAVVVSPSYRLAPDHPAPVPSEDCWAATRWVLARTRELGVDPTEISVMGASAGGNLAALVAIAHRDLCRATPGAAALRYQVLIYPATDLSLSSSSVAELGSAPILTRAILDWYGRQYLPHHHRGGLDAHDPRVSPVFHPDLSDCAPALIIGAGQDPLRDDATRYGDALGRDHVPHRVIIYPDAIHGFISMPRLVPDAERAVIEISGALGGRRYGPGSDLRR